MGFMFEWYGLFLHEFAHGNYGWGSTLDPEEFILRCLSIEFWFTWKESTVCYAEYAYNPRKPDAVVHDSFPPSRRTKIKNSDIPTIMKAKKNHPKILENSQRNFRCML